MWNRVSPVCISMCCVTGFLKLRSQNGQMYLLVDIVNRFGVNQYRDLSYLEKFVVSAYNC